MVRRLQPVPITSSTGSSGRDTAGVGTGCPDIAPTDDDSFSVNSFTSCRPEKAASGYGESATAFIAASGAVLGTLTAIGVATLGHTR